MEANTDLTTHALIFGLTAIDIATVLTAIAAFAMLVAVYSVATVRDPMRGRVKALQERREQLKAGITASRRRTKVAAKAEATNQMRQVLKKLKVLQDEQAKVAAVQLSQAGIRSKDAVVTLLFCRLVLPFAFGAVAAFLVYGMDLAAGYSDPVQAGMVMGGIFLGYKAPDIFVTNLKSKRTDAIRKGLPDALDLLVICAEAGLTVDAAFNRVSKELGKGFPELADEFALTAIELGFLQERRQAYENLSQRVDLESLRGVVTTLVQTEKYGTPLASALRVLSGEFRNERMMRAEEKAARLPAIMTVPLILFILPVLFIVILGPAACSIGDALG
ncbi:pilus assembly protein TadC [Pacificimonas flava]|uniref:Pilus assembly protein TadC n=2 Tax=Pacificimonas TaxID=1960290 RepID=A0A219B256_9SPHN|nr:MULTISPECIES: type II secretion system F family protein [Pacificimonas]MBZ6377921.1 type II secretion system F family protein [Pacificimonas aurantium]OWV32421.1 pilus assembly protein TadC [Pacificimonas flava]